MSKFGSIICTIGIFVLFSAVIAAQSAGIVRGRVADAAGAGLAGARVQIESQTGGKQ